MNFISKRFVGRANRRSFALPISFIVLFPYISNFIAGLIIVSDGLLWVILGQLFVVGFIIFEWPWFFPLLSLIYLFILPITVRRLHDIGCSGWLCLLLPIPFVNCLFVLFLIFKSGNKTENKYGKVPTYQKKPSHIFFWSLFIILIIATTVYTFWAEAENKPSEPSAIIINLIDQLKK